MITVQGIELDFDLTAPQDVLRYKKAGEKMEAEAQNLPSVPQSQDNPLFLESYVEMLNGQLKLFGNFLDEVFGEGVAVQLLGAKPSLNKVVQINDEIERAMESQGKEFGVKMQKYQPNRATRRAN